MRILLAAAAVYGAASLLCFILYAIDKRAARRGQRRMPERTLLLWGLACGWPGALLAQRWLRHKSSKASFLFKFWPTVLLNLGVAIVALLAATSQTDTSPAPPLSSCALTIPGF
jgi:uncharacterized membrane protein YsdA (DUF1294 family)